MCPSRYAAGPSTWGIVPDAALGMQNACQWLRVGSSAIDKHMAITIPNIFTQVLLQPVASQQKPCTWKARITTTGSSVAVLKRSLIWALTSVSPATCGSDAMQEKVCQSKFYYLISVPNRCRCPATCSTFGSWMKLWPDRVLGGNSPVQACFRHSMIVCENAPFNQAAKDEKWP